MADRFLDARAQKCPMPIVQISKTMRVMEPGQVLEVLADDPVFLPDAKAWCRKTDNELMEAGERDGSFYAVIRKAA